MDKDLKSCSYCKRDIAQAAVKCPFCQEWLTKRELSLRNPYVKCLLAGGLAFVLIFIVPKFIFYKWVERLSYSPKTYVRDQSKVYVESHNLVVRKNSFVVVGVVRNDENITWSSLSIVATFRNQTGALSSLGTGSVSNLGPKSSKAFEVSIGCAAEPYDKDKYATYDISVDEGLEEVRGSSDDSKE